MRRRLLVGALALGLAACGGPSAEDSAPPPEAERTVDVAALRSLPYAQQVPVAPSMAEVEGVVRHDRERAEAGLNLLGPRDRSVAYLVDMAGEVVHSWRSKEIEHGSWHHLELLPGGDLVVVLKEQGLARLSWDSELLDLRRIRAHHDVAVRDDGSMVSLTWEERLVVLGGEEIPVLDDRISFFAAEGEEVEHLSMFDLIADRIPKNRVRAVLRWAKEREVARQWVERGGRDLVASGEVPPREALCPPGTLSDLFHLNSVEILPRDVPGFGRRGHLLVSVRELDLVVVIDPEEPRVVWSWGPGQLQRQHHPTLLDNDHILIFDNGPRRKASRVVEVDPASRRIVWEYRGGEEETFYSHSRGSNQRLPGGNTLITESDYGRVLEVTPGGEIVWELFSPFSRGGGKSLSRSAFYRVTRVTDPAAWNLPLAAPTP
jgi:hypothetical protein